MPGYDAAFKAIALNAIKMNPPEPGDYKDKDGNLICGKCHTPRSKYEEYFGEMMHLPIPCRCRQEAEEKKNLALRTAKIRENCGLPKKYVDASFSTLMPDPVNERSVRILKRYSEKFSELYKKNQGLIIHGGVGTGKTHIAACAMNGIINQGYSALFVSLAELLQKKTYFDKYQAVREEEEFMTRIRTVALLVIDDFGAERATDYALEFVYNVINARCNANKPIIVTTNLTFNEMLECQERKYARIYNRLFETCSYPVEFKGESKRIIIAADKNDEMSKLLEVDDESD